MTNTKDTSLLVRVALALAFLALCVAVGARHAFADEASADDYNYTEGESSPSLVDAQSRAAAAALLGAEQGAALLHALDLQMQKYDRDMTTDAGRRSWHGKLVSEEIYTNDLVKIQVYSNEVTGATWRYRTTFKPKADVSPTARKVTYSTNGIPARLAAARAARAAEINAGTTVTNVVIEAGTSGASGTVVEPVTGEIDESAETVDTEDTTEADTNVDWSSFLSSIPKFY